MIIRYKRLDYSTPWSLPDLYLFTGNPVRRSDGGLVMGRGAARQLRDSYPGIDKQIRTHECVAWTRIQDQQWIGYFQVKNHWAEDARIELIEKSTSILRGVAHNHPKHRFHMNFPGIGNGRLNRDIVLDVIESLPNNVTIYE